MSYGIIYRATGPTGKVYIGQTIKTLAKRKAGHKAQSVYKDRRSIFQSALLDEGFDNFTWEQIDTAETQEELDTKEKHWIDYYKADNPQYGYNTFEGGGHAKHTKETRQKLSEANRGEKNPMFGKHHTSETRQKLSDSHKGINTWMKGRKATIETIEKRRHALLGRHHTQETIKKISESKTGKSSGMKGKHQTEDHRRKISEAQRGEKGNNAKLTESDVREIKRALAAGEKCVYLAKKYGVRHTTISLIKHGKNWNHVQIHL